MKNSINLIFQDLTPKVCKDLKTKIEEMESKYDEQFQVVFEAIRQLLADDEKPKRKIGF